MLLLITLFVQSLDEGNSPPAVISLSFLPHLSVSLPGSSSLFASARHIFFLSKTFYNSSFVCSPLSHLPISLHPSSSPSSPLAPSISFPPISPPFIPNLSSPSLFSPLVTFSLLFLRPHLIFLSLISILHPLSNLSLSFLICFPLSSPSCLSYFLNPFSLLLSHHPSPLFLLLLLFFFFSIPYLSLTP